MRKIILLALILSSGILAAESGAERVSPADNPRPETAKSNKHKKKSGAGGDIGGGAANIGSGAAKDVGSLATGTARGAVDLAALHPVGAGISIASGAATAGKDVGVGAAKGGVKITRGVGKLFRKVL